MGEQPGHIRWVEMDEIEGMSASTHSLPLSMLASFLNWELKCEVTLLGIQLKSNDVGETVNVDVVRAVNKIVSDVRASYDFCDSIPDLGLVLQPQGEKFLIFHPLLAAALSLSWAHGACRFCGFQIPGTPGAPGKSNSRPSRV